MKHVRKLTYHTITKPTLCPEHTHAHAFKQKDHACETFLNYVRQVRITMSVCEHVLHRAPFEMGEIA